MTEMTSRSASSGQAGTPGGAAGGLPDESDLPRLQGLDDADAEPPTGAGSTTPHRSHTAADATRDLGSSPGQSGAGSDPMPDMSGTGGV